MAAKFVLTLTGFLLLGFVAGTASVGNGWTNLAEIFKDTLAHFVAPDQCSEDLIAYYKFDRSLRDFCFGHNAFRSYVAQQQVIYIQSSGILNGAASFNKYSDRQYFRVPSLNGHGWGSKFSVSLWFKNTRTPLYRGDRQWQGLINNGPVNNDTVGGIVGSWEIQVNSAGPIGVSLVTSQSDLKIWNNVTTASIGHWHHIVLTYDGSTINFYLNSHLKLSDSECCHGDIVTRNKDVVIGQTKYGRFNNYGFFKGLIDEVKLFRKSLTSWEVKQLYQLKIV